MSEHDEIMSVFEDEIFRKTLIVYNKQGKTPFYDGFAGFQIEDLSYGLGIERIICSEYTPKCRKRSKCLR